MEASDLLRSLLRMRGVTTEEEIAAFLAPDYDLHTHDPFLMRGMDAATERLLKALQHSERIAVYADFDCDGIPGASLLNDFFKRIGYPNVETYIPHRDREGYGFHEDAIAALASRGVSLIITVDVGTNAREAVALAKEKGMDVIVTDHHELIGEMPAAVAVLNPKRAPYPFSELCGAAVAFKLVCAALREGKRRGLERFARIPDGWEKWLLDLVAIATVADMVPLVGENRVLVYWGLKVLRRSRRSGIRALCDKLRLRQSALTEEEIGFSIAPRINAASRMDDPEVAFRLLTTDDSGEAAGLASALEKLNTSRKGAVGGIVREAKRVVRERFPVEERIVVIGDPEWKPSLLGLAANSIVQERGGLVCLWGRDGAGNLRGSCRADGSLSIAQLFANAGDVFVECGGHHASGGFSVSHEQVHHLQERLSTLAHTAARACEEQGTGHDLSLHLPDISEDFFTELSRLSPYGTGNKKPTVRVQRVQVNEMRRFGKEKGHLELLVECSESGRRMRAYDFFRAPEQLTRQPSQGEADLLATVERDTYRGGLALRLIDLVQVL